jgi:hypothetical protein
MAHPFQRLLNVWMVSKMSTDWKNKNSFSFKSVWFCRKRHAWCTVYSCCLFTNISICNLPLLLVIICIGNTFNLWTISLLWKSKLKLQRTLLWTSFLTSLDWWSMRSALWKIQWAVIWYCVGSAFKLVVLNNLFHASFHFYYGYRQLSDSLQL